MSRVGRVRRRAGHSAATHERARGLAAQRMDAPLEATDSTWLQEHLATCESCTAIAAAYEADRVELRVLRDRAPEPPRDLWARTSAAIERESAGHGPARRPSSSSSRSRPAIGVLSGVAVIAVVIGASIMSGGFLDRPATTAIGPDATTPAQALASTNPGPEATPMAVGVRSVGWVGTSPDGALAYNVAAVAEVCPPERQPDCAPVADGNSKRVEMSIKPKSISQSPVKNQAVVVGTDPKGDDAVLVIALPTPQPTATPAATPAPTGAPTATPSPAPPTATPTTPGSSPEPTPTPTVEPTAAATPTATPTMTAEPTLAATLAIVSGVTVVGQSASYSPDGAWFAFSARPSNDSTGPDIYVWRVGDPLARSLTHDHASVFASWVGERLIGSRPTSSVNATTEAPAQSFFLDPTTGDETAIAGATWRPIVDPSGKWAVGWDGTIRLGPGGLTAAPASGALALREFTPDVAPVADQPGTIVADGPVAEFDVRWDETGKWLAVWLADASDPAIGRLSLLHVDPKTGRLDRPHGAPQDVTALPGFSIADGRLAWATPPGQGGDGSRVQIVAWTGDAVGAVESGPVEGVVVVH